MKTYALMVTEQEVELVAQGLLELPMKWAAPLINKIKTQVNEQQNDKGEEPVTQESAGA